MSKRITVSGTGCCLVDLLYNQIDFTGSTMQPYLSKTRGDGGLLPGKLVFREEFEKFTGASLDDFVGSVAAGRDCDAMNIGGPSIVSLIHAAQLTERKRCEIRFYGKVGNDPHGKFLVSALHKTPVVLKDLQLIDKPTPSTLVLSDPEYDNGHGERMFINSIGAAWEVDPDQLDDSFFESDIVVFGGTALVPRIHDNLASLLARARSGGSITIVNTVFDFRSESTRPAQRWTLGESEESYRHIDLLITDREEAFGLSGETDISRAISFFRNKGLPALIITNGSQPVHMYSEGPAFGHLETISLPVSRKVVEELAYSTGGDTTGCGDNFTGGIIASVADQLSDGVHPPDLSEACAWGIVSGGYACFYMGGTYMEKEKGEKLSQIKPFFTAYKRQIQRSG